MFPGVLLSGGLDSSLTPQLQRDYWSKLHSFSIGLDADV
jgi:asparagine synthetase B (glutamine-hydrolysing)